MLVVPGASPNFCFALDVVKHASEREPNREVLWPVRIQRYGMSCQFCTEKQCVTINTAVDRDHSVTQPPPLYSQQAACQVEQDFLLLDRN